MFTVTFNAAGVTGLELNEIQITPASGTNDITLTAVSGPVDNALDGTTVYTYRVAYSPSATTDQSVSITILDNTAMTSTSGGNIGVVTPYTFTFDRTAPTITNVETTPTTVNNGIVSGDTPIQFTVTFSEPVLGFGDAVNDVTAAVDTGLGTITVTTPTPVGGSDTTYTFRIEPDNVNDQVDITIPAGAITDAAENDNAEIIVRTLTFDTIRPTVTISSDDVSSGSRTNIGTVTFTVEFDAIGLTQLSSADIMIVPPTESIDTLSHVITSDRIENTVEQTTRYTFTISYTGTTDQSINITIPQNVVTTAAGNGNMALDIPYTFTFDKILPTISDIATNPPVSNGDTVSGDIPIEFTVTFSESITGLTDSDISVSSPDSGTIQVDDNPMLIPNSDPPKYTFTVRPTNAVGSGVTITILAGAISDTAGNTNELIMLRTLIFDDQRPTATISSADDIAHNSKTNNNTITFIITFSERIDSSSIDMADVNPEDVLAMGDRDRIAIGPLTPVVGDVTGTRYQFIVTFESEGTVTLQIPENAVTSAITAAPNSGLGNIASNVYTVTFDETPLVRSDIQIINELLDVIPETTSTSFTIRFSEAVIGFVDEGDVLITNPSVSGTADISAPVAVGSDQHTFTFIITSFTANGQADITIPAGAFMDTAGNENELIVIHTVTFGSTDPTDGTSSIRSEPSGSSGGGGKTTPLLASQMITYNTCSQNQDAVVRILTFNLPSINTIQANLYTSKFVSYGVDVTSQVPVSTYLKDINPGHVYTIFDAKLPAGTQKFFVTVFDTENVRWATSTLIDLTDPSVSAASKCANTVYPHELKDPNTTFVSPIEPIPLETLPVPVEQLHVKLLDEPVPVFEGQLDGLTTINSSTSALSTSGDDDGDGDGVYTTQSPTRPLTPNTATIAKGIDDTPMQTDPPTDVEPPSIASDIIVTTPNATKEIPSIATSLPPPSSLDLPSLATGDDDDTNENKLPVLPPSQPQSQQLPQTTTTTTPSLQEPSTKSSQETSTIPQMNASTITTTESPINNEKTGIESILSRWINDVLGWFGIGLTITIYNTIIKN